MLVAPLKKLIVTKIDKYLSVCKNFDNVTTANSYVC